MENIHTWKGPDEVFILEVRETFNLNSAPWDTMDNDLVHLAFIPNCSVIDGLLRERLMQKYGTCDHQSLEVYGDITLYTVVSQIIFDHVGLAESAGFITRLKAKMTTNRLFTDFMINKNGCRFVRITDYQIRDRSGGIHNVCADSFESLIGAMFIHAYKNLKVDAYKAIRQWFERNTEILSYLYDIIGHKKIVRHQNPDASETIYVNPYDSVESIFNLLGWTYHLDEFPGYLAIIHDGHIIGVGATKDEADLDAIKELERKGYIAFAHMNRTFTKPSPVDRAQVYL
jgi:hypothetical protein